MVTLDAIRARHGLPDDTTIAEDLERGLSLPTPLYVDPDVLELEHEKIFDRCWQYACHEDALSKPGDHAVTQAGRTPIIVVRDNDGGLRAFVNACRHRLHPLATENGHRRLLQCPYHGWSYELDGQLKSAPRSQREAGFDCSAITLAPVSVEAWDQWIFVNPDPHAQPLAELTAPIRHLTDELNADLVKYRFSVRYEYEMSCNWKVWAENALECYHCPTLHRASFGRAYRAGPDQYHLESFRDTVWHSAPTKWVPTGVDPETLKGFRFAFLYPGSFYAVDDYVGFVGSVYPTGPETCSAFVDMYTNPEGDQQVAEQWLTMWDQTLMEDKMATDRQQIGYRSGRIPYARLLPDSEHPLQAFLRRTWTGLTESSADGAVR